MSGLILYVYFAGFDPSQFFNTLGTYPYDEPEISRYLGDTWKYLARAKYWLGERQIFVELGSLVVGFLGTWLGWFPLTGWIRK
ncbi:MAG: hypothetical protein Kapaf2KO_15640 [Candidatus Kapaibacteriales bacterium]